MYFEDSIEILVPAKGALDAEAVERVLREKEIEYTALERFASL